MPVLRDVDRPGRGRRRLLLGQLGDDQRREHVQAPGESFMDGPREARDGDRIGLEVAQPVAERRDAVQIERLGPPERDDEPVGDLSHQAGVDIARPAEEDRRLSQEAGAGEIRVLRRRPGIVLVRRGSHTICQAQSCASFEGRGGIGGATSDKAVRRMRPLDVRSIAGRGEARR